MLLVAIKGQNQVLSTSLTGYQLENGEKVLFQVKVEIGLKVAEPNRGLEDHALALADVLEVLDADVWVEVGDDVQEICFKDFLEIGLDFGLEVVQAVNECSDITF